MYSTKSLKKSNQKGPSHTKKKQTSESLKKSQSINTIRLLSFNVDFDVGSTLKAMLLLDQSSSIIVFYI